MQLAPVNIVEWLYLMIDVKRNMTSEVKGTTVKSRKKTYYN